jgi:hypothetical protein
MSLGRKGLVDFAPWTLYLPALLALPSCVQKTTSQNTRGVCVCVRGRERSRRTPAGCCRYLCVRQAPGHPIPRASTKHLRITTTFTPNSQRVIPHTNRLVNPWFFFLVFFSLLISSLVFLWFFYSIIGFLVSRDVLFQTSVFSACSPHEVPFLLFFIFLTLFFPTPQLQLPRSRSNLQPNPNPNPLPSSNPLHPATA